MLDVSVSDELEVEQGTLRDSISPITTNYGYYIKKYQLEVYRVGFLLNLNPSLYLVATNWQVNDSDINWDGQTDVDYQF
ncbi:hypothetical protein O9992_16420 [Vibrio lentus]|nr:hypothetical protein [Vibrio lentus]